MNDISKERKYVSTLIFLEIILNHLNFHDIEQLNHIFVTDKIGNHSMIYLCYDQFFQQRNSPVISCQIIPFSFSL